MPEENDEQFLQRRLLLASLLSAAAIMGYFYFGAQYAPPVQPPAPETRAVAEPSEPPPAAPESPAEPLPEQAPAGVIADDAPQEVQAEQEREIRVRTGAYEVVFSNRGAVVKSWTLEGYKDSNGKQLDLVHQESAAEFGYPFLMLRPGGARIPELDNALFTVSAEADELTAPAEVVFEYADPARRARKVFRFQPDGYVFNLETELIEGSTRSSHLVAWPGGFGDTAQLQDHLYSKTFYWDPVKEDLIRIDAGDAEDALVSQQGPFPFFGIEDLFFTAVFLPVEGRLARLETGAVRITPDPDQPDVQQLFVSGAFGLTDPGPLRVYIGPKSLDELRAADPRMGEIVEFGFFSVIAEPLFWMMRWTHDNIVANWGWSIVLVTVFINILLFPLKWKGSKQMKRMQKIQPLVKQLNDKYKGLSMRDPRKAKQNEELMELYKKYKVNPVGGCLPMLLQLPFLYGFYKVLTVAIEMRHAQWLWIDDLSQPEQLAIRVLPLAMVATQFLMQTITPMPSADPAQARVMKFMPLIMGFIFYGFQSGLVLYWLTSNVVGIGQQALLNRLPAEELEIENPRKRSGKRKK